MALAVAGWLIGEIDFQPTNTVNAEPAPLVLTPQKLVHDTVTVATRDTIRDTVQVEKKVVTTKYRNKSVIRYIKVNSAPTDQPMTVVKEVEVPVLYTRTDGDRKETPPDSTLLHYKRVNKRVIVVNESETRQYIPAVGRASSLPAL